MEPADDQRPLRPYEDPGEPEAPRFCKRCGNRLDLYGQCMACTRPGPPQRPLRRKPDSSLGSALGLYFALLASFIVVRVDDSIHAILIVDAVDALLVLIWSLFWWRQLRPLVGPAQPPSWYGIAAAMSVATVAVTVAFIGFLTSVLDGVEVDQYAQPYLDEGYGWHWIILSIVVQPALVEEFAFRGVIIEALGRVLSVRETIIVSAVLFTILHLSILSFPNIFMMGLLLAWVRFKSGSIWPGVILHACHNALVLVAERQGWG